MSKPTEPKDGMRVRWVNSKEHPSDAEYVSQKLIPLLGTEEMTIASPKLIPKNNGYLVTVCREGVPLRHADTVSPRNCRKSLKLKPSEILSRRKGRTVRLNWSLLRPI